MAFWICSLLLLQAQRGVAVGLQDGSWLVHRGGPSAFTIDTGAGALRVPLDEIRTASRREDGRFDVSTDAVDSAGRILDSSVELDTSLGRLTIPVERVRAIRDPASSPEACGDPLDGPAVDAVLATGRFTLEIEATVGSADPRWVRLAESASGLALFADRTGRLRATAGGADIQTAAGLFDAGRSVRFALAVDRDRFTILIDGAPVLTSRQPIRFTPTGEALMTGGDIGGLDPCRSPDERGFVELRPAEAPVSAGVSGVRLRDGSFVAAEFSGNDAVTFTSAYGEVRLDARTGGSIQLSRIRPGELGRLKEEVEALIDELDAERYDVREAAHARLLSLGAPVLPMLRDRALDPEASSRVRLIVESLREEETPPADVARFGGTRLMGRIQDDPVTIHAVFGTFTVPTDEVASIEFGPVAAPSSPVWVLQTGEWIEGDADPSTRIDIDTRYGALSLAMGDIRDVRYVAEDEYWVIGADCLHAEGVIRGGAVTLFSAAGRLCVPAPLIERKTAIE